MMTLPLLALSLAAAPPVDSATRAVAYLVAEVPRWPRDHKCYSCHHSGDATRTLLAAKRLGYRVPNESLADTVRWLARPAGWDKNGGEGPFNDQKLARVWITSAGAVPGRVAGQVVGLPPEAPAARSAGE